MIDLHRRLSGATLVALAACLTACSGSPGSADPPEISRVARVYPVEEALASFVVPDGYRVELVAAEPMVEDPVAIDFDADGRMYVAEMRGYMPNLAGTGEDVRNGRIVVLEDSDDDGQMDRRTVFMDSLVLPRSVKVLEHGVLIAATPNLWFARDLDGDLKADTVELLRDDYGTTESNPEHNANGLLWGIDNWIKNANFAGEFRLRDGEFEFRETPSEGQWGVSMDEYGRLYRNSNSDPLRADLIPAHYAERNPEQGSLRGVYERLTSNVPVFPARPTPAVNRGYQPGTLRDDSTLAMFTAAGSPTAFVGDRLPEELRNDVFVTESAGNLVARFDVNEDGAIPSAEHVGDGTEFMASTDQRFRPVYLSSAPDGTLYVVDMYRGIIQHRAYITGYLEQQIHEREMEQPTGLGRIYRIVHESTEPGERPQLSGRTPAQLVEVLKHPNGWWRITAQRLLVERGDRSVAPALRQLVQSSEDERARLHALWTLDGLGEADRATVEAALVDRSPHLRAAAVRIAEPLIREGDPALEGAVMKLAADESALVRRQAAATLGELPASARDSALARVALQTGDDPVVADLVVSGVPGHERAFLEKLLSSSPDSTASATVRSLVATLVRSRDPEAVGRVLAWASEEQRPRWQRVALLEGVAPSGGGFGGRGRGGGTGIELTSVPDGLLALSRSSDPELSKLASSASEAVRWPGKPRPESADSRALTPEEQRLYDEGEKHFLAICAGCHQANGEGLEGVAKSLVGSRWALSSPGQVTRIVLHGKEGEMLMPPVGSSMSNEEIASVLTYVRRSWGNDASPISVEQVAEARGESGARRQAWTEEELQKYRR